MPRKLKYGVRVGRSGCRFVVGNVSDGDLRSFQFSRGGWGQAVNYAREMATRSPFMALIDIVCRGNRNRMPLMQCGRDKHCEPEVFPLHDGEPPIAGLTGRRG